jgi:predicted small lipoprotein YifL
VSLRRVLTFASAILALAVMTGCATKAPTYQPSIDNVNALKKAGNAPAAVGAFTVQANAKGGSSISLRAAEMTPPAGGTYAAYLAEALKTELELAQRLGPKASIEISGVLLKNNIDAGGISTNSGEIEAQFSVRRDGKLKFDKTKRATGQWESSFAGAVAIPKAQQQYPLLVQSLLGALYADPEFQAAIR